MRERVNVSLVQFASAWLDRDRNAKRMAEFVEHEATDHAADLVVFPELANTGYIEPFTNREFALRLYDQSEKVPGPTTGLLCEAAHKYRVHIAAGLSRLHATIPDVLLNTAVLISPEGQIIGLQDKIHPCREEKNYYAPGASIEVFATDLGTLALNVCYDVRFPELARVQALKGAEIFVSVWASYSLPGRVPNDSIVYRCATRAMENATFFLGVNRSGTENDRVFYGRSVVAAPSGDILARSHGDHEEVIRATLKAADLHAQRAHYTIFRDRRPELYGPLVEPIR